MLIMRVYFQSLLCVWLLCGLSQNNISAQVARPGEPAPPNPTLQRKAVTFDVVSIKLAEHPDPHNSIGAQPNPTSDGYKSVTEQSLWATIMLAYYQSSRSPLYWRRFMLSGPPWLMKNQYVIDAKVAPSDVKTWQQGDSDGAMLRGALQQMLKERCNLTLHRAMVEHPVQALMVKPGGKLKIKEANPNEAIPNDATRILVYGGAMKHLDRSDSEQFYNVPIEYVVAFLTAFNPGPPVVDQTGLKKRYDFVISHRTGLDTSGISVAESTWDLESIGLMLKPAKASVETLVIDHIEEPTSN